MYPVGAALAPPSAPNADLVGAQHAAPQLSGASTSVLDANHRLAYVSARS